MRAALPGRAPMVPRQERVSRRDVTDSCHRVDARGRKRRVRGEHVPRLLAVFRTIPAIAEAREPQELLDVLVRPIVRGAGASCGRRVYASTIATCSRSLGQLVNPYSCASTSCASDRFKSRSSGASSVSAPRRGWCSQTRARASGSPRRASCCRDFAWFFRCSRSAWLGSDRGTEPSLSVAPASAAQAEKEVARNWRSRSRWAEPFPRTGCALRADRHPTARCRPNSWRARWDTGQVRAASSFDNAAASTSRRRTRPGTIRFSAVPPTNGTRTCRSPAMCRRDRPLPSMAVIATSPAPLSRPRPPRRRRTTSRCMSRCRVGAPGSR